MTKTESLYQVMVDHCRKLNFPIVDHEKLRLYCWHIYQGAKYDEPILKAMQEGDAFLARELQKGNKFTPILYWTMATIFWHFLWQ